MEKDTRQKLAVFAMVALTCAFASIIYLVTLHDNTYVDKDAIDFALENYEWDIMQNYSLEPNEHPLLYYEGGWFKFRADLNSTRGPWEIPVWCWYNEDTEETFIQVR